MAKSSLGKTVSRVGSSGGGGTYRKARPFNFYAIVLIIVVLGLAAVVYSRYERQHPSGASTVWPTTTDTGFIGLASQQCGTVLPVFKPVEDSSGTYKIGPKNVLTVAPTSQSQAGLNANVATFTSQTTGFSFSSTKMTFPGPLGTATTSTTYVAGTKCSTGTKYAGQVAYPIIAYWRVPAQAKPTITTNAASVHFTPYSLVTFAFEPKGVTPTRPSPATISAMYASTASTTTTSSTPTG